MYENDSILKELCHLQIENKYFLVIYYFTFKHKVNSACFTDTVYVTCHLLFFNKNVADSIQLHRNVSVSINKKSNLSIL